MIDKKYVVKYDITIYVVRISAMKMLLVLSDGHVDASRRAQGEGGLHDAILRVLHRLSRRSC